MSDDPLYFFSYSRQELYFAEAAVLALQQAGLNIWFDLQQLEPGCNWSEEIQRGLQDCAGIILLASRAALNSPWVALEWEHGLEKGKPVYVLLFEAVKFDPIPASEATNNQPIPLDRLQEQATAILDVRRHFHRNMSRLASLVRGKGTDHDPIPVPNRWRIPTAMPYAVALVALALGLTTAVMLWMSLYGFSVHWPMMLAGLAITAWLGSRTIAFLRRRSFREARAILPAALLISPFISLVLTPVLALGTLLILWSRDVNRWSPLGQGIDRSRYKAPIPQNVTPPRNWLEHLAHDYAQRLGRFRWVVLLAVVLLSMGVTLPAAANRSIASWMLLFPVLTGTLIIFEFINRRLSHPVPSGRSYQVVAAPEDRTIADQVDHEMRRAGHKRLANASDKGPDFIILVLSNYTPDSILQSYARSDQKLICVTASALDDWSRYKPLARFQWVDYRRQQRSRLAAMALDILNIGDHKTGYSFSTQQTPESFNKTILPSRTASGIGCMYISIYMMASMLVLGLLYPVSSAATLSSLITTIIIVPVYIWLMIRVTRREIGLWMLILVGLIASVVNSVIGSWLGISIYQTSLVNLILITVILNVVIYYPIYRATVGSWLPIRPRRLSPFAFRRDRSQWGFHLGMVVLAVLLSLVFLYNRFDYASTPPNDSLRPVSYENQFMINVPAYWYPADSPAYRDALTRTQVLARALGRVSLTFGESAVKTINQMLNGGISPVIIPSDPIEQDAQQVGFKLVEDARYVPDAAQISRSLRFDLWVYPRGFLYTGESRAYFGVFEGNPTFAPLQPVDETALTDRIRQLEQRYKFKAAMPDGMTIPLEFRLDIFETPAAAFLLSFVADSETMQTESSAIEKMIASAQVNVQPAPAVQVTLDRLRFEVPAIWETAAIPDVSAPSTWQGAAPTDITRQFIQQVQAKFDQFTLPIQVIWGARIFSFRKPVFAALARCENATPNDLGRTLDFLRQQDSQMTGVQPTSDNVTVVRDDFVLRIIAFEFADTGWAEWYAGVYINGQAYLIVIASDPTTLSGYSTALTDWLTSFNTVQ